MPNPIRPVVIAAILFVVAGCTGPAPAEASARSTVNYPEFVPQADASPDPGIVREEGSNEGNKHALLVAIGQYPRSLGYKPLRGVYSDVRLMRSALLQRGFTEDQIQLLRDSKATKKGILRAFDSLTATVSPGDLVVIHYSGHGDRLTDDNPGDPNDREPDGYDEALVPYDAPSGAYVREELAGDYDGSSHLRDDEIRVRIANLRQRLGTEGHVLLILDSCHSGSASRGELVFRSGDEPIGKPAVTNDVVEEEFELDRPPSTAGLASYVSLFASSYNQLAAEILHDGQHVGAMTLALSEVLADLPQPVSYDALYQRLRMRMKEIPDVTQDPQIEGDREGLLLDGRFQAQQPYFVVDGLEEDGTLRLDGGLMTGLTVGSRVAVYPFGTNDQQDVNPILSGTIVESAALSAWVQPEQTETAIPSSVTGSWAFVTQQAYENLVVGVTLETGVAGIEDKLQEIPFVELNPTVDAPIPYRLRVFDSDNAVIVETVHANVIDSVGVNEQTVQRIVDRIEAFGRNQFLRDLHLADERVKMEMTLIPATIVETRRGARCEEGGTTYPNEGGTWQMNPLDAYFIDVSNSGQVPAYFTIVSLMPGGEIDVLFPFENESDIRLFPGDTERIECLRISENQPEGIEELKLFATYGEQPLDLRPIIFRTRSGDLRGNAHPLEQVLENTFRTRSDRVGGFHENASTSSLLLDVKNATQ